MPQTTIRIKRDALQPLRVRRIERRRPDPELRPERGDGLDPELVFHEWVVRAVAPEDGQLFCVAAGHLYAECGVFRSGPGDEGCTGIKIELIFGLEEEKRQERARRIRDAMCGFLCYDGVVGPGRTFVT